MKIILTQDVKKHGKKGDIIEVKDGFGMNYLIKNNFGIMANESGMKKLNTERKLKEQQEEVLKNIAIETKNKLAKTKITFKVKTGKEEKVFGTISPKQIEAELKKQNIVIDKKKIIMNEPISSLGVHIIKIELYKEIIGEIRIELVKESR